MNILDQIVETKKDEVQKLKSHYTLSSFNDLKHFEKECLSISDRLREINISIISEIKKASPSKGVIQPDFNHLKIAESYLTAGTDAISVLTDKNYFQGDIQYLNEIADFANVPLLRKDFIIDEFQVFEAKAHGADFILLISEILSKSQINEYSSAAHELGMQCLLELHSENELEKISSNKSKIIGINNRNLKTFKTSIETTFSLSEIIDDDFLIVSESGFNSKDDFLKIKDSRTNGLLVGEYFMKSDSIIHSFENVREWLN